MMSDKKNDPAIYFKFNANGNTSIKIENPYIALSQLLGGRSLKRFAF
jgi:hypothetical protein